GGVVPFQAGARGAADAGRVTVGPVPGGGKSRGAKPDAEGTIHLFSNTADGPQYVKSTDGAKSFSKPMPIVDRASRRPNLEFLAWDMAVSPQGCVHVAMGTNAWKLKLPQEEWGFLYARLEPGADTFSPVQNLNHKPS